jgi:hypothetical protein
MVCYGDNFLLSRALSVMEEGAVGYVMCVCMSACNSLPPIGWNFMKSLHCWEFLHKSVPVKIWVKQWTFHTKKVQIRFLRVRYSSDESALGDAVREKPWPLTLIIFTELDDMNTG